MAGKTNTLDNNQLDASQVENWLKNNPDFFVDFPNCLSAMEIPVDTGAAISLHQYQVRVLQADKAQLKQKLGLLVKNVKTNHRIHSDLLDLAGKMIILARQEAKLETHLDAITEYFSLTKVLILDRKKQSNQFKLAKKMLSKQESACFNAANPEVLDGIFGEDAQSVSSFALVPIKKGKKWSAVLVLAADDIDRFQPGMGGEFLKLLARLVANLG